VIETVEDAGQWFSQTSDSEGQCGRELQQIGVYDALWNDHVFRVGSINEKEIVAQVWEIATTVVAAVTWCRVVGDNPHAFLDALHLCPTGNDRAAEFMAKYRWWGNHTGMPASQKDFEISAAGSGGGDAHQHLTLPQGGYWKLFKRHVLRSV
jgi:hypothetical protein